MKIAIIGLGKMGANMVRRLINSGHEVVVYDFISGHAAQLAAESVENAFSLEDLINRLPIPRVLWLMIPASGAAVSPARGCWIWLRRRSPQIQSYPLISAMLRTPAKAVGRGAGSC